MLNSTFWHFERYQFMSLWNVYVTHLTYFKIAFPIYEGMGTHQVSGNPAVVTDHLLTVNFLF
jgi:hypothetical protein